MGGNRPKRERTRKVPAATLGVAIVFSCFWIALGSLLIESAREHDFLSFYTGGMLARQGRFGDLYDRELQTSLQRELVADLPGLVPYIRPPFYALALAPLSFLSLHTAFWIWLAVHIILLIGCWRWALRHFGPDAVIYGSLYLPAAIGIAHGQDGVFWLCLVIWAYNLTRRGEGVQAGVVLAFALVKFHLLILVPVVMLLQKRWGILQGFCLSGGTLALGSLVLIGSEGLQKYLSLVTLDHLSTFHLAPELSIDVRTVGPNLGFESRLLDGVLILMVIALVVLGAWRAPLWRWLSASLVGSLLIAPLSFGYDATILLLPLWMVLFRSQTRLLRFAGLALVVPLPFFIGMMGAPWSLAPFLCLFLLLIALTRESYLARKSGSVSGTQAAEIV